MDNIIFEKRELESILDKGCSIYGAGNVALEVIQYAFKKGKSIKTVLVSNELDNPKTIKGIEIRGIQSVEYIKDNLIVATRENLHEEIKNILRNKTDEERLYFVSNNLHDELMNQSVNTKELLVKMEEIKNEIAFQRKSLLKFTPRPNLDYLIVHILDHCNLKCMGCDHFACIADKNFISYEMVSKDIFRMAEIFESDYITRIAVMGGEPLLHPDVIKILMDVRKAFPYAQVQLSTNGLLLLNQSDEFFKALSEYSITVNITKYPINIDYESIRNKLKQFEIEFIYHATADNNIKRSFKKIINLKGNSDPVESFYKCHISNYGNFLLNGRFYGCAFSCLSSRIFNDKFNQNLRLTKDDYLDIYEGHTRMEFFEFAARPKHYCRYCQGLSPLFDWQRTTNDISEWVDVEQEYDNDCIRIKDGE